MERTTWPGTGVAGLLDRAIRLLDRPGRTVLGIAGAPASGKSTLATLLLAELDRQRPAGTRSTASRPPVIDDRLHP